ncbi:hypothetical protein ZWY2020_003718 [Hordeum vulgare]|nr:hypothetical protein ZWY2020_003718 [Hordeum vulgare]
MWRRLGAVGRSGGLTPGPCERRGWLRCSHLGRWRVIVLCSIWLDLALGSIGGTWQKVVRARRLRHLELVGRRGKGSGRAWPLLRSWAEAREGLTWCLPVSWGLRDGSTDVPAVAADFSGVGSSASRPF